MTTKAAVAAEFARHGSGYVLTAAIASSAILRARRGRPGIGDLTAVATVVALQPFVEWGLHRFVLHGEGVTVAGRRIDPGAPHRGHHRVPDDVAGALLGGGFAVADGAAVGAIGAAVGRVVGGPVAAFTGAAAAQFGLLAYEWVHLLTHTGYRPVTAPMRALRRHHLRHHFRDERTNYGVTSTLGDRLLGTAA